jgi:hypothetical protein
LILVASSLREGWPRNPELAKKFVIFVVILMLATTLVIMAFLLFNSHRDSDSGNGIGGIISIILIVALGFGILLFIPVLVFGGFVWALTMWVFGGLGFSLRSASMISAIPCALVATTLLPIIVNWKYLTWNGLMAGQVHEPLTSFVLFAVVGFCVGVLVSALVFGKRV